MQNTDLPNLVRQARSPLGALLAIALVLILATIGVIWAVRDNTIAVYGMLAFVGLLIAAIVIFIMSRTPKTPAGLTATEEYYAHQLMLQHMKLYGRRDRPATRSEVIESTEKEGASISLPPTKETRALPNKENDQTESKGN